MRIFVTGATGWIGSAVVPELIANGHEVVGLARSDTSAGALEAAGAEAVRGSLDDLDVLAAAAAASDGVIHLAFKHEEAFSGNFPAATAADRRAVEALGQALAGSSRPLVIATGMAGHTGRGLATEEDDPDTASVAGERMLIEQVLRDLAEAGVRTVSVRLSPSVHGDGDPAFVAELVAIARRTGVSGYVGDGQNRWPSIHRDDAARLFRLALEQGPAGSVLHGVADDGVPLREIAEVIGRSLGVPTASIAPDDAAEHFGWLAAMVSIDIQASSLLTRRRLGWEPEHDGLIADLESGHYFRDPAA